MEVADATATESTLSAFTSNGDNPALGLGGNAGGPYGNRGRAAAAAWAAAPHSRRSTALSSGSRGIRTADGRWDCDQFMKHDLEGEICDGAGNAVHDVGVTGLALLAFLGDNHTLRAGKYRDVVKRGVMWLRSEQQDNGLFGSDTSHDYIYDHAIATYAMCEACGLSRSPPAPAGRPARAQLPRVAPQPVLGLALPAAATATTTRRSRAWAIMAYEAGKFFELQVSDAALQCCAAWLDQVCDSNGRHGYRKQGELSSRKPGDHKTRFPVDRGEAMTAVGLFSRFFLGQNPKEVPVMKQAATLIGKKPPVWDEGAGAIDHYYWYYATYALFQIGGRPWQQWQKALGKAILPTQHQDRSRPNHLGSWDPVGAWGDDGGRVYSTAILTLTLQAHYRYSPLLR